MPVMICDLEYRDWRELPGIHPTDDPMAIIATQNTQKVANFMSEILDRNGDHIGNIKCVVDNNVEDNNREWIQAFWLDAHKQAVYGQKLDRRRPNQNQYISLAENLGIVAHEMFHGVTCEETTELSYEGESGSLHESYSDIFAIIILNHGNENIGRWNWELGRPFGKDEDPIRNFANPTLCGQPAHWNGYDAKKKVHYNCGIHNKAAYNLMNATYDNSPNEYLFNSVTLSRLFYLTLGKLGHESTFRDSGVGLLSTAATIFRKNENLKSIAETAINQAFADVGITL